MLKFDTICNFRVRAMVRGAVRSFGINAPCKRVARALVLQNLNLKGIEAKIIGAEPMKATDS